MLVIRCRDRERNVYVATGGMVDRNFGDRGDGAPVRYRLDQEGPVTERWQLAKSGNALFVEDPTTFIRKLARSKTLLFEFTPYSGSAIQVRFPVWGLADKLPKFEKACPAEIATKDQRSEAESDKAGSEELRRIAEAQREQEREQRAAAAEHERQQQEVVRKQREADEGKRKTEAVARASQPKLIDDWKARIQARIRGRIVVPPNMEGNPEARFEIVLLPGGEVLSANLKKSSGNPAYDAAVERAIAAAQPLPVPTDTDLFQENFRELNLVFRPKD